MATPMPLIAGLGTPELIIILVVVMLLFGAAKLPELARGSGRALRIFKAETKGLMDDDEDEAKPGAKAVPQAGSTKAGAKPAAAADAATPVDEQEVLDRRQAELDRLQADLNAERDKNGTTGS